MGKNQGLAKGNIVDVVRTMTRTDPYDGDARYEFKIKIGQLKVLHVEAEAAITTFHNLVDNKETPYVEIPDFMVGDEVKISVD